MFYIINNILIKTYVSSMYSQPCYKGLFTDTAVYTNSI